MMQPKRAMPKFTKAPDTLVKLFTDIVDSVEGAQLKKMFGYPAAFVAGNMFFGIFQDRMMLRLADTDRTLFMKEHGAKPFEPMPGRPMKEYVEIPEEVLGDSATLRSWVLRGKGYASTLGKKKPARRS